MTKDEIIQQIKNETLNAIRKIYNPKYKFSYDSYSEDSYAEQRESTIQYKIEQMEQKISETKDKFKQQITL